MLEEKAAAVLIFPNIVKAGFIVGGQYGQGALRKKGKTVDYYSSFAGSYGLQAGAQSFGYALFLRSIARYREDIVVGVECIFPWYWLADLCARENITFVLGHALYMKAIHGGKAKNDKIDAHKIAALLRGGMMPMAYVYPPEMRSTRDLMRRRMHLVNKRAELLAHVQHTNHQYNLPEIGKNIGKKCNREGVAERFPDVGVQKSIELDLAPFSI